MSATKKSKAKKKAEYEQKGKLFLIILAMLVFTNLVLEFVHNIAIVGYTVGRLV